MVWEHRQGDVEAIRRALATRDSAMLTGLMTAIPFAGASAAEVERELRVALAEQDHATQQWWGGSCTCHPGSASAAPS